MSVVTQTIIFYRKMLLFCCQHSQAHQHKGRNTSIRFHPLSSAFACVQKHLRFSIAVENTILITAFLSYPKKNAANEKFISLKKVLFFYEVQTLFCESHFSRDGAGWHFSSPDCPRPVHQAH